MSISVAATVDVENNLETWLAGDLEIAIGPNTVKKGNKPLDISGLTFDLLVALVRAAPSLVCHDDLAITVWQGRIVTPETVAQRVKLLRKALGDDAANPRYIGLVKRRGYKLLPTVKRVDAAVKSFNNSRLFAWYNWAISGVLLAAVSLYFWRGKEASSPAVGAPPRIAVLPFHMQSAHPDSSDFLAASIHDDIISELAQIKDLLVLSRTTMVIYEDTKLTVKEIGRELEVDNILEGTMHHSEDQIKINVQLINTATDTHLWAKSYEYEYQVESIIKLQRQVAIDVANDLRVSLSGLPSEQGITTKSIEAYEHYLAARRYIVRAHDHLISNNFPQAQQNLLSAAESLQKSIAIDPRFAQAHAYYSLVNSRMYEMSGKKDQALLNQSSTAIFEALKIDPNSSYVLWALGYHYQQIGNHDKSLLSLEEAARGLPNEVNLQINLAMKYLGRTYRRCIESS